MQFDKHCFRILQQTVLFSESFRRQDTKRLSSWVINSLA